jgi:hypothetical protein
MTNDDGRKSEGASSRTYLMLLGEPTRAGSKVLADEAPPARTDALVVRRLRAAGAVIAAKNNMSEIRGHHLSVRIRTTKHRAIRPIDRGFLAARRRAGR